MCDVGNWVKEKQTKQFNLFAISVGDPIKIHNRKEYKLEHRQLKGY